jgi:pimeloyl-ACP methyl ester carboxylesterase
LFPELLGRSVARLVLVHTTYTNPLSTVAWPRLARALQKPVIEPLLHLQIWLSPLVWLLNWLSYWNGSAHRSAARTSLAGTETRSQLDFVASFQPRHSPAVLARGALGMLQYDATEVLQRISVPTLVVAGDRDPVTSFAANARNEVEVADGHIQKLVPGKHCGHLEHDRLFAERVAAFCRTNAVTAPHFGVNESSPRPTTGPSSMELSRRTKDGSD